MYIGLKTLIMVNQRRYNLDKILSTGTARRMQALSFFPAANTLHIDILAPRAVKVKFNECVGHTFFVSWAFGISAP